MNAEESSEKFKADDKKLLDKMPVKSLLAFIGLISPVPVLLTLINLWKMFVASPTMRASDPFTVFRQIITQANDAPIWLLPLALIPSLVLLMILFRTGLGRFSAALAVVACASVEVFCFMQMISL